MHWLLPREKSPSLLWSWGWRHWQTSLSPALRVGHGVEDQGSHYFLGYILYLMTMGWRRKGAPVFPAALVWNLASFILELLFLSLFPLLLIFPLYICYTFCIQFLEILFWSGFPTAILFAFLLPFQFWKFLLTCLQPQRFFPQPIQRHSSSVTLFIFSISFLFFLRICHSLLTLPICSCLLSTFSVRALSISIILVLNSQADNFNTPAISESGPDACSVSSICFLSFGMRHCFLHSWLWYIG